jgi:hypothetical protein
MIMSHDVTPPYRLEAGPSPTLIEGDTFKSITPGHPPHSTPLLTIKPAVDIRGKYSHTYLLYYPRSPTDAVGEWPRCMVYS